MKEDIHIKLAAERIGELWGVPITNTLVTAWLVMAVLAVLAVLIGRRVAMVPGKTQTFVEALFGGVLGYMEETLESRSLARKFFPLIMTIFLFILFGNLMGLLPIVGSIGVFAPGAHGGEHAFTALFRPINTDLNVTLALAVIAFFAIEITGIAVLGFLKYAGKFVNFKSVIGFLVGIIELISEIARLISFSFRLFGNIFAGKVLILVALFFVPYFLPVPLLLFEVMVGVIQAAIFALLTLFFIKMAVTEAH